MCVHWCFPDLFWDPLYASSMFCALITFSEKTYSLTYLDIELLSSSMITLACYMSTGHTSCFSPKRFTESFSCKHITWIPVMVQDIPRALLTSAFSVWKHISVDLFQLYLDCFRTILYSFCGFEGKIFN